MGLTPLPRFVLSFSQFTTTPMTTAIASGAMTFRRLPTAHGAKALRWTDRIKGGSTRVRTHGGAAGSHGTRMSTANSALADVR